MFSLPKLLDFASYIPGIQVLRLMLWIDVALWLFIICQELIYACKYIIFRFLKSTLQLSFYSEFLWLVFPFYSNIYQAVTIYLLRKGISQCSKKFLGWFVILKIVFLPPGAVLLFLLIIDGPFPQESSTALGIFGWTTVSILALLICYMIFIVYKYYRKLESPIMTHLQDYYDHLKTLETTGNDSKDTEIKNSPADPKISYKLFKKYILSPLDVTIDTGRVFGEGEFGTVYKGTLLIDKTKIKIAAKVAKEIQSSEAVVMILQEIKILIHVGQHENIIKFYGVTSDASLKHHIAIISEICAEGQLDDFLEKHHSWYIREFNKNLKNTESNLSEDNQDHCYVNIEDDGLRSVTDLLRFSLEIVKGMNHLAAKKVIHGDLASRNILLTSQLRAKISDFGMSRRLYNYQMYSILGQEIQLPWRWMSIEVIEDLKFSEKSDVWAFGIVLWEIFSLGEIPYHNLQWSSCIPLLLRNGTRLQKPKYASDTIHCLMQNCWKASSDERPNFSQLKSTLEDMYCQSQTGISTLDE